MEKQRNESGAGRTGLALALVVAMATIGCTTNRMPGTGEPYVSGPAAGPTPPSATRGSSGGTIGQLPATPVPASEDAAAIMAAHQGFQGRVLGPVNPDPSTGKGTDFVSGQFYPPSLIANPQITVNSSISSGPNPAITSGAGETGAAAIIGGAITAGATAPPVTGGVPLVGAGLGAGTLPVVAPAATTGTVNTLTTSAAPLVGAGLGAGTLAVVAPAPLPATSPLLSQPLASPGRVHAVTSPTSGASLGATSPPVVSTRGRSVRISNTNGTVIISNADSDGSAAFARRVRATRSR